MIETNERKYRLLDDKIECTTGKYSENNITISLSHENISEELLEFVECDKFVTIYEYEIKMLNKQLSKLERDLSDYKMKRKTAFESMLSERDKIIFNHPIKNGGFGPHLRKITKDIQKRLLDEFDQKL